MGVNIKYLLFVITLISLLAVYRKPLKIDKLTKDQRYVIELMKPFKNIKHRDRIRHCILRFSYKYDHDPKLFARLIRTESGFDRLARSRRNAYGLTQVKSKFWDYKIYKCRDGKMGKYLNGLTNKIDHSQYFYYIGISVEVGAMILRDHLNEFGTLPLALICYNYGRNSDVFRKAKMKPETAKHYRYVKEIMND